MRMMTIKVSESVTTTRAAYWLPDFFELNGAQAVRRTPCGGYRETGQTVPGVSCDGSD